MSRPIDLSFNIALSPLSQFSEFCSVREMCKDLYLEDQCPLFGRYVIHGLLTMTIIY